MSDDWIRRRRIALAISVAVVAVSSVSTGLSAALIVFVIVGALLLPFVARGQSEKRRTVVGRRHAEHPRLNATYKQAGDGFNRARRSGQTNQCLQARQHQAGSSPVTMQPPSTSSPRSTAASVAGSSV